MAQLYLNDIVVQSLKSEAVQTDYYCTKTKRFGIRVTKGGCKTFFVIRDRKRISLGRYPQISLKSARRDALAILHVERDEEPEPSLPMHEAVETYFRTVRLSPAWDKEQRRLIGKHFLTKFGKKDIVDINTQHILQATDVLADRPAEQVHTHKALQTFFRWALRRALIEKDPMVRLQLPAKLVPRDRVLTNDELKKIWEATLQSGDFGVLVQLLILTGQRRGEIANVHLATVTADSITWPKHLIKNRREQTIPLTPRTAELIAKVKPRFAWSKPKADLDKLCGVKGWQLHDLRRTFATSLAELGVSPHVIERILNHVKGTISRLARIYNRATYQREMREALERYEQHLFTHVLTCNS